MAGLKVDVRIGESIKINGPATITLMEKSGKIARLEVRAAKSVTIEHIKETASRLARSGLTVVV